MSELKLKPCPFCGSTKLKIDSKRTYAYGGKKHCSVTVRCGKCHARSPVAGIMMPDGEYDEREICATQAAEAWNSRIGGEQYGAETQGIMCDPESLGDILICAVRYACGRRTYITRTVTQFVKPLLPRLGDRTVRVILESIDFAERMGGLGDDGIDVPLWVDLREACAAETERRSVGK